MERRFELFRKTIVKLGQSGVLSDMVLIDSWCLYFYRILYNDAESIPAIRTVDIDFFIPNPPKIKHKVNIPLLLEELGFIEEFSHISGHSKFIHADLEVEFITPEKGRGKDGPHLIKEINISAQGLRYVNVLLENTIIVPFDGLTIKVPEPTAFVLHKLQISNKRGKKDKQRKDLETAIGLGEYLIARDDQVKIMKKIFDSLPGKWKKEILSIAKTYSEGIFMTLNMK